MTSFWQAHKNLRLIIGMLLPPIIIGYLMADFFMGMAGDVEYKESEAVETSIEVVSYFVYPVFLLFGLFIYLELKKRKKDNIFYYFSVGFVVGYIEFFVILMFWHVYMHYRYGHISDWTKYVDWFDLINPFNGIAALCGGVAAVIFWLIARPDQRRLIAAANESPVGSGNEGIAKRPSRSVTRVILGVLLAPVTVSTVMEMFLAMRGVHSYGTQSVADTIPMLSPLYEYPVALLIGPFLYVFFRNHEVDNAAVYALTYALIGYVSVAVIFVWRGRGYSWMDQAPLAGAVCGGLAALVFWLIARPDELRRTVASLPSLSEAPFPPSS